MKAQGNKGIAPIECTNPHIRKYVFRFNFQDIDENTVEFDYIEIVGHEPTRNEKIHAEIRARYEDNDELMIIRQYNAYPDNPAYKTAFDEYNEFVEGILSKYPEENEA